jgi:hypothetical protein
MGNCLVHAKIYEIATEEEENEKRIAYQRAVARNFEGTYLDEEDLHNPKRNSSFASIEDYSEKQKILDEINDHFHDERIEIMKTK